MKPIRIILFGLVALGQLAFAAQLIMGREAILREGKLYRFKTAPIDPNDPFRGKYVRLDFEENSVMESAGAGWEVGQSVFVQLEEDSLGYAQITELLAEAPDSGNGYLKARIRAFMRAADGFQEITLEYPFERYYLEESKAPEAERRYRESNRDNELEAYAKVRIKAGEAVLEDVIVDGISLRKWGRRKGK